MRKYVVLTAIAIAAVFVMTATSARADESKDAKPAQAAKDPNYRWHDGQWWYWVPQQKHWLVWNGGAWTRFDQAQANRGVRSFSYQADNPGGTYTGGYYSNSGSMGNGRIIGSYGFHSAGSKAMGNY